MATDLLYKFPSGFPYSEHSLKEDSYDFIYLSPHFDDAVLSCGGSLFYNKAEGWRSLIVTLFGGNAKPPFSPIAQDFHRIWTARGSSPYLLRREEDREAMAFMEVDFLWIDWPEIIYRDPNLTQSNDTCDPSVDPTSDPIFATLCNWLNQIGRTYPQARFIAPLGAGSHRDHRLIHTAARHVCSDRLHFFEDFPYCAKRPDSVAELVRQYDLVSDEVDITHYVSLRIRATELYQSQVKVIFRPPYDLQQMVTEYTSSGKSGRAVERYWRRCNQPCMYVGCLCPVWIPLANSSSEYLLPLHSICRAESRPSVRFAAADAIMNAPAEAPRKPKSVALDELMQQRL